MLKGKTVLLAVTGSIAAYKTAYLASALRKLHAQVHVLMTANATNFINPITFESLTGNKCLVDTFVGMLNAVYSRIGVVEYGVEEIFKFKFNIEISYIEK